MKGDTVIYGKVKIRKKDGSYQAILPYKYNEHSPWKQKSKQGFKTKTQANNWIPTAIKELEEKTTPSFNQYSNEPIKRLLEVFIEYKSTKVKPGTLANIKDGLRALKRIENRLPTSVTPFDLEFIDSIRPITLRDTTLAKSTCFFNFLIDVLEIDIKNPCRKLKYMYKKPDKRPIVSLREYDTLIYPNIKDPTLKLMTNVQIRTGLRVGELLGLTLEAVNKYELNIFQQWNVFEGRFSHTKNRKKRICPITKKLYNEIMHYVDSRPIDITGKIFTISYRTYSGRVARLMKDFSPGFTTHCFRHSFATHLVSSGVDFKTIAELIGDTLETTMKTYSQPDEEKIQAVRNLF